MTLSEEIWQKKIDLHLTWAPFAIRYFQSYATLWLHQLFRLPIRESFFAIQFGLALVLGPLFYRYLRELQFSHRWSLIGVALLFTAYPIHGAHFAPTHTWDDFWSYLFLVLTFLAAFKKQPIRAGLYLTLGCFAREQILIFGPLLALWFWFSRAELKTVNVWIGLILPPMIYGLFRIIVANPIDPQRWRLISYNFESAGRTADTLVSLLISFGIMWLLATIGIFCSSRSEHGLNRRFLIWGFAIAVPLTTALTLTCTFARETRILFPPFIFMIPLSIYALQTAFRSARKHWTPRSWLPIAALFLLMMFAGLSLSTILFPETAYGSNARYRRRIAGVHIGLIMLYAIGPIALRIPRAITSARGTSDKIREGSVDREQA